ncbi:MAG: hypothetical protein E2603_11140 [Achromobacter sp.]|nr:hypothetical protein [Achromobacter sp.]
MTISTEAAKVAGQNQVTDADLLRICQSFNPGQDFDLAKAVRAEVLSKQPARVAEIRIGVSATGQGATVCIMQPHADGSTTTIYSEMHPLGDSMGRAALAIAPVAVEVVTDEMVLAGAKAARDYFEWTGGNAPAVIYRAMRAAAPAAPQASVDPILAEIAEELDDPTLTCIAQVATGIRDLKGRMAQARADAGITASHDVATVVAFIFERFGLPGYAGDVPANVVTAMRRLEAELQPQAGKDDGPLVGHFGTTVTDVMVTSLASLAYRYAMTLSSATRHADCDQLEGIARRVTAKLKDEIRAIISGQSGSSS